MHYISDMIKVVSDPYDIVKFKCKIHTFPLQLRVCVRCAFLRKHIFLFLKFTKKEVDLINSQVKASDDQESAIVDIREDYSPPEILDLGDVSAVTKGFGCNFGSDGAYS